MVIELLKIYMHSAVHTLNIWFQWKASLQLKDRWHNPLLCLSFQVCQCWWPTPFFTTQESTLWMVAHLTSRCLSALRTGSWAATTSQATTLPQGCPTPFSPWSSSLVYPLSSSRPSTYQYTDTSRNTGESSNENPLHRYSLLLNCQHTWAYEPPANFLKNTVLLVAMME